MSLPGRLLLCSGGGGAESWPLMLLITAHFHSTCDMPGSGLSMPWGPHSPVRRHCFYTHLIDKEAEAQSHYVTCPRSRSRSVNELGFEPRQSGSRLCALYHNTTQSLQTLTRPPALPPGYWSKTPVPMGPLPECRRALCLSPGSMVDLGLP